MQAVIVADDLTGASDTAAAFCGSGRVVAVSLFGPGAAADVPPCDVWALDVHSRGCSPEEAYRRTREAAARSLAPRPELLYKKLDSALRGGIGCECDAVVDAAGADLCIVAPAVPRLGRTTVNGVQRIGGTPVHETGMGRDPMNPVRTSEVSAVLRETSRHRSGRIGLDSIGEADVLFERFVREGVRYAVCDAETDEQLDALVSAGKRSGLRLVWAGAAGLAEALARAAAPGRMRAGLPDAVGERDESGPEAGAIWFVSGSQTEAAAAQLARLEEECGVPVRRYTARELTEGAPPGHRNDSARAGGGRRPASGTLSEGSNPTGNGSLTKGVPLPEWHRGEDAAYAISKQDDAMRWLQDAAAERGIDVRHMSELLLGSFARRVAERLEGRRDVSRLVLIGGETARAVLSELNIQTLLLEREFAPGSIESYALGPRPLRLITKSGSFGDERTLARIWKRHRKGGDGR